MSLENISGGKTHGAPDGGIRMPGMIKWPGVLKPGHVTDEPISQMDVFLLISKIAKVTLPNDRVLDGKDILPLLKGETMISPHEFLFHYCGDKLHAVRYRPRTGNDNKMLHVSEIQLHVLLFIFTYFETIHWFQNSALSLYVAIV